MSRIAIIPGDGIGVDVTHEAVKVLGCVAEESGIPLDLVEWDLGAQRYLDTGVSITPDEMADLRDNYDAIFLGAMGDPRVPDNAHARDILLGMRFQLDLFINLRPAQLFDRGDVAAARRRARAMSTWSSSARTPRACTSAWAATSRRARRTRSPSRKTSTRARASSASSARRSSTRGRTAAAGSRCRTRRTPCLSRRVAVAPHVRGGRQEYPDSSRTPCTQTRSRSTGAGPARYDVIVAPNLFGDILSDLAAALVGGLGLAPSASLHPGRVGLFEPVHGSAPDLVGTNRANPLAAIMTAALMLRQLGHAAAADAVERSVRRAVHGGHTTPDLGGQLGTDAVGDWVCRDLRVAGLPNT
jgi:3-isopropylmalate dehydrogenase